MARPVDSIKELLKELFQQAPVTLHHVLALDGKSPFHQGSCSQLDNQE